MLYSQISSHLFKLRSSSFLKIRSLAPTISSKTLPIVNSNLIISQKSFYSLDPDYGKYASPSRMEAYYDWVVDTSAIQTIEKLLISFHDFTGLPWWASILGCTIILRLCLMTPLYIIQTKNTMKYQRYLVLFKEVHEKLATEVKEKAAANKWDESMANQQFISSLYHHRKQIYKKYKIPGAWKRYLLPAVQIPVWVCLSMSLRHMTLSMRLSSSPTLAQEAVALQLSQEGCLWFSDLCMIDCFYIMPIALCILNLTIIEIYRGDGKTKLEGLQKYLINFSRAVAVLITPVAMQLPSGVVFYWFCSSMYGAAQALTFKSFKVRRFFRIPIPTNESKTPYKDLFNRLKFRKL